MQKIRHRVLLEFWMQQIASILEDKLFLGVARATGEARGEFWDVEDLARNWVGARRVLTMKGVTMMKFGFRKVCADVSFWLHHRPNSWLWWALAVALIVTLWLTVRW